MWEGGLEHPLTITSKIQNARRGHVISNDSIIYYLICCVSGQLPTRTIPHCTGIGPDEWFYSVVVVLVGNSPNDHGPVGQWLGYIFIQWGIVLGRELS